MANGTLQGGLTLTSAGALMGTPTTVGTRTVQLRATDTEGRVAFSGTLEVGVHAPLVVTTSKPAYTVGAPFTLTVASTGGAGERTTTATGLPAGWSFDGATVTGTPVSTKSVSFTLTTRDAGTGWTVSTRVTVAAKAPLTVPATTVPAASKGQRFSLSLRAAGGYGKYTWSVAQGTLPPGLTLTPSGVVSGTPTTATTGTLRFEVRDADGRTARTEPLELAVEPALQLAAAAVLPNATRGKAYSHDLDAGGGNGEYTFTAVGLPTGLKMNADGRITGTSTAVGSRTVTVKVTDSAGRRTSRTVRIAVVRP